MIKDNSLLSDVLPDTNILLAEMWLFQYTADGEIVLFLEKGRNNAKINRNTRKLLEEISKVSFQT